MIISSPSSIVARGKVQTVRATIRSQSRCTVLVWFQAWLDAPGFLENWAWPLLRIGANVRHDGVIHYGAKTMKPTIAIGLILTLASTPSSALDYKGVPIGESVSRDLVTATIGGERCKQWLCHVTIGGVEADLAELNTRDLGGGQVVVDQLILSFPADEYLAVEAAVTQKFGKPTKRQSVRQENAYGASVTTVFSTWKDKSGNEAVLMSHVDMETGALNMKSAKFLRDEAAEEKQRQNDL